MYVVNLLMKSCQNAYVNISEAGKKPRETKLVVKTKIPSALEHAISPRTAAARRQAKVSQGMPSFSFL